MKIEEFSINGFTTLNKAAIDACSLIYLIKAGLLGSLGAALSLISVEEVIKETGWNHLPVESIASNKTIDSNDEKLIDLAISRKLPVISDDKEVLEATSQKGLPHYNSLMMLNYLFFKNRVSEDEYSEYESRIIEAAHYTPFILDYSRNVFTQIKKTKEEEESR